MRPNPQETADLATFTEKILNGKLHFSVHCQYRNWPKELEVIAEEPQSGSFLLTHRYCVLFSQNFSCPKKIVIMRLFLLKNTFLNPDLHVLLEIHILRGEVILTTPFQQSNSRTLNFCVNDIFVTSQKLTSTSLRNSHCVKSVKTRSFF